MGLLGFLRLRVSPGRASSVSASRYNNAVTASSTQSGHLAALARPFKGLCTEAIWLSHRPSASTFVACRQMFVRTLKAHVKDAFAESRAAHELKGPNSTEPDTFVLAISGYRLFKILKNHVKGALTESPPAYPVYRQSKLPFDGRRIDGCTHPFRAIAKHAFRQVGQSTYASNYSDYAFKAFAGPTRAVRFGRHRENSPMYLSHAFNGGKHSLHTLQHNHHGLKVVGNSRNFARTYAYAHGPIGHFKAYTVGNASTFKGISWSSLWRAAWQKLLAKSGASMSILPPLGLTLKAVSLACARSHLPLGLMAMFLGSVNHNIAQAQGSTSFQSSPSSFVLSSLFSLYELFGIVARSLFLWALFMPAVLMAPFADMFGGYFRQTWLHLVHHTLEFAGAAFIKWGQWAATRPDLFPRDLCLELSKLHANAPAHKFSYTVQSIERAFGKKLDDIFIEFEEKPVASGSIAQVHKATLRHGGSSGKRQHGPMTVAVKVRHPGVTEVIRRDFIIINWIANLSTLMPGLKWLRLDESVRQFAVFMLTQVDLAREAAHLSRFLYNFRSWRDVSFPRPVYPLVHPAVLVESYEQGESVSHYIELSEKSKVNRKLAHIGTHTFLKMLLVDNFIHADMHPGNILVRIKRKSAEQEKKTTSVRRSQPHLVFLDVGLTAELSQKDRGNLLEFFKAVALRDGRTAAQCTLAFSANQSCPDPPAFIKELETSFKFWGTKEADVIHPGECMQDLLEQVRRHRVNVDGNVCTVMVTIMVLEGWQRKLDPDFNIMTTLQKLIFKQDWAESLAYTINGIMAP